MYPQRPENCYLFAGTKASLALPTMMFWHYSGAQGWTCPLEGERLAVDAADPQGRQLAHFLSVVRGEEAPRVDAADAMCTLAATLAVAEAARKGTTMKVPIT
jgi:predicted dehydrogenase